MNHRLSTTEEIKLISQFLTKEADETNKILFDKELSYDEKIDSFVMAQQYFYSTIETPYGYKIISLLCFLPCEEENACDMFQSRFVVFSDNRVQDITECDWLAKDETFESLTEAKKESGLVDESENGIQLN